MSKTETVVRPRILPKDNIAEPPKFCVIYINDDVTTQEFVIETLKIIFDYEKEGAEALTMRIHEEGSAVVAVLPYEIAEQKGAEVAILARQNGFPLQIKLEQHT